MQRQALHTYHCKHGSTPPESSCEAMRTYHCCAHTLGPYSDDSEDVSISTLIASLRSCHLKEATLVLLPLTLDVVPAQTFSSTAISACRCSGARAARRQ